MLKAGVIGLGKMGISHCSILGAHPYIQEIAVCDTSEIVLAAFKKHSRFNCYNDYIKMITECELDFVIVATPTKYHSDMVTFALENKCHVFCEKPMALEMSAAQRMCDLAQINNLVSQVGYHNRFIGTFMAVKRFVDQGLIGNIYHIKGESFGPVITKISTKTWRSNPGEGGGCLLDYASHVINLMQYIVGGTYNVDGTVLKKIFSKDVEDAVYSTLFYANDITGQVSVNWSDETYRKMVTSIEVLGIKGKIVCDTQECQVYLKDDPKMGGFIKGWNSFWITDQTNPVWFNLRGEEYSFQLDHFINSIKENNVSNLNSFHDALKTEETIAMLRENAGRNN